MSLIIKAQTIAHEAHDSIGQKRKYSGLPYWVHTDEVASIVASVDGSENQIIAAHLHDIIEDVMPVNPKYDLYFIAREFNDEVAEFVKWLTDEYTKEAWPDLNRAKRKVLERERVGKAPNAVKTIKLADLISNTTSIVADDPDFAHVYLKEKFEALPYLIGGDSRLLQRASIQTLEGFEKIGLTVPMLARNV